MILFHGQRFGVAKYHRKKFPYSASQTTSEGLVVTIDVHFDSWLRGQWVTADAFVDPGADGTVISLRWIDQVAEANHLLRGNTPSIDRNMLISSESVIFRFEGQELPLPHGQEGPKIGWQGLPPAEGRFSEAQIKKIQQMPGYEDILIGRDFLTRHRIMLVVDGEDRKFSMLYPIDYNNKRRRKIILGALDPDEPLVKVIR